MTIVITDYACPELLAESGRLENSGGATRCPRHSDLGRIPLQCNRSDLKGAHVDVTNTSLPLFKARSLRWHYRPSTKPISRFFTSLISRRRKSLSFFFNRLSSWRMRSRLMPY